MSPLAILAIATPAHVVAFGVAERLAKNPRRAAVLGILRTFFWHLTMLFGACYFFSISDTWWEQWGWAAVFILLALCVFPLALDDLADTLFPNREETPNHD